MALGLRTTRVDDVAVVHVAGEIDYATRALLAHAVWQQVLTADPPAQIVVDLAEVTLLDAAGVGTLMAAKQCAHRARADLVIRNAHGIVRRVLQLTGLAAA